jgi:glycosyltransferase involved in cell wall biosynthesis
MFDEVFVIDSNSTDATVEISISKGAQVLNFNWDGKYPKKKQWALDHAPAGNEWILLLDADEYPSEELVRELATSDWKNRGFGAFDLTLSYRFAGAFLRFGHRVTKRSLLRTGRAAFPEVNDLNAPGIREVEGHYQPEIDGKIGQLRGRLMHDDRDPVRTWFDRHNRYSDWEAHLRMDPATRREIASKRSAKGAFFDRVPFKSLLFFLYSYLFRLGFLDGRAGFDYAVALSNYYWQIGLKARELERQDAGESSA